MPGTPLPSRSASVARPRQKSQELRPAHQVPRELIGVRAGVAKGATPPWQKMERPKSINDPKFKLNIQTRNTPLSWYVFQDLRNASLELAKTMDRASFLARCLNVNVTPKCHVLRTTTVQNTWDVKLILRRYAVRIMKADLDFQRLRKHQLELKCKQLVKKLKEVAIVRDDIKIMHSLVVEEHKKELEKLKCISKAEFRELLVEHRKPVKYTDLAYSDEEQVDSDF